MTTAKRLGRKRLYDSITLSIGNTPLVKISRSAHDANTDMHARLAFLNLMPSVKVGASGA